jgi:hypothetical protein
MHSLGYSLSMRVIEIIIVALAEELPTSVWLLGTPLSGVQVPAMEVVVSAGPTKRRAVSSTARMAKTTDFFTSTTS